MKDRILEILTDIQPSFDFTEKLDFIEYGYLDSFDIVMLVSALENEYGISISALDIVPENFCSLDAICRLVTRNKS